MQIEKDFTLPANYLIDERPGWPEPNEVVVRALLPENPFVSKTGEFLNLRFYPNSGPSWFGEFEIATRNNLRGICSSPNPDVVFVMSGWQVFRVDVAQISARSISTYPVTQMKADPYRHVIWLASFGHIEAIASDGRQVWKSNRLLDDDLRVLEITPEFALIEGFDGGSVEQKKLSLGSGKIVSKPY